MSTNFKNLLRSRITNGWNLFWLITAPISIVIILAMVQLDLTRVEAIRALIQLSVRCAVPWLFLAFAASSLHQVFPSLLSHWLLSNRKIIGLNFAAAMGWQLFFIVWLMGMHTQYFVEDLFVLSTTIEGLVAYTFLLLMVLTSFKFGRSLLNPKQWKTLHKTGMYWLWAYVWGTYWAKIFFAQNPVFLDYAYYWIGFLAWAIRMYAWSKKRWKVTAINHPHAQD